MNARRLIIYVAVAVTLLFDVTSTALAEDGAPLTAKFKVEQNAEEAEEVTAPTVELTEGKPASADVQSKIDDYELQLNEIAESMCTDELHQSTIRDFSHKSPEDFFTGFEDNEYVGYAPIATEYADYLSQQKALGFAVPERVLSLYERVLFYEQIYPGCTEGKSA